MEPNTRFKLESIVLVVLLISWFAVLTSACPNDSSDCRDCILKRMKYDCPSCVTTLRCMAKCLWAGTSKTRCTKKCDCNDNYPKLSDCKNCMSKCRCSCAV
ncbi:uncharacterized protein LOC130815200 [Amaranthus tricolor]|uniref:uncharacterized protein LOC130815200 n=1 Tax=Amaranthus tricolor TaxID=29722 RepID=UPI0025876FF4|nr:uncharacterized protein LOC130815200 [Amaranthus tricolor]